MRPQVLQRLFLVSLLILNCLGPAMRAQVPPVGLHITIVEGDGAINNIRQRVNRDPVVQVEDDNRKPIAGAVVIFFLPDSGPSGAFVNGSKTLTVTTDDQGQAAARGVRFNNQTGQMQIRVTASFGGQTASAIITQTNAAGVSGSGGNAGGMSTGMKVVIALVIVGAAAGAGTAVYIGTHNSGSSTASVPPIVLAPGTPTVGGPK